MTTEFALQPAGHVPPIATSGPPAHDILRWLASHAHALLDDVDSGLVGVGLGKKSAGPIDDESPYCITGFVETKLSKGRLRSRRMLNFAQSVSAVSDGDLLEERGIEIDVVEVGAPFSAQVGLRVPRSQRGAHGSIPPSLDMQKPFDALRIGIGITNPMRVYPNLLSVGTLGFFVRDEDGKLYLVSNNHVIANENRAKVGDAIVQPGTLDLTSTELSLMNTVGKLRSRLSVGELSAWVDIAFSGDSGIPFNELDCAIAKVDGASRKLTDVARIGLGGNLTGVAPPLQIDPVTGGVQGGSTRVYKVGRTTGWTEGDITALNVVSDVRYEQGKARFINQIGISPTTDNGGPFSNPGDSGSGIIDSDHLLVGPLFAGGPTRTLANPIAGVLSGLQNVLNRGILTAVI